MATATRDKRATIENCMIAMCLVIGERFRKEWIGRWSKESSGDRKWLTGREEETENKTVEM